MYTKEGKQTPLSILRSPVLNRNTKKINRECVCAFVLCFEETAINQLRSIGKEVVDFAYSQL